MKDLRNQKRVLMVTNTSVPYLGNVLRMPNMKKICIMLFLIISSTYIRAGEFHVDAALNSIIDGRARYLISKAIMNSRTKYVRVFIDSPGGYLETSLEIINIMKAAREEGFFFTCHILKAESAAASIFAECDERVAYLNSTYAQHRAGSSTSGKCSWLCSKMDIVRLENEAHLLGMSAYRFRESLPPLRALSKRIDGRDLKRVRLATKFINKNLNLKIKGK